MFIIFFLLFFLGCFKAIFRFLNVLFKFIMYAMIVGILLAYFYIISWGSATIALWAILRERNGNPTQWMAPVAMGLFGLSMYLLTLPSFKENIWFFGQIVQGTAIAAILLPVYLGMFLYRHTRQGDIGPVKAIAAMMGSMFLFGAGLYQFDRSWYVSRLAMAGTDGFATVYHDFKRDKYAPYFKQFMETYPKIPSADCAIMSRMNACRSMADPPRDLILVGFQSTVATLYYTLDGGFREINTREDFISEYVSFRNGELTYKNPEIATYFKDDRDYIRAIENGSKVFKETSLQLELVEANIDAYIWYREHNGVMTKELTKSYATLSYLREHGLPQIPPNTKDYMAKYTELSDKGLTGRLY